MWFFDCFVGPFSEWHLDCGNYLPQYLLDWAQRGAPLAATSDAAIMQRYKETAVRLPIVPAFAMESLQFGHGARVCYVLGQYLNAIVLSALCAEKYLDILAQVQPVPQVREVGARGRIEGQGEFVERLSQQGVLSELEKDNFNLVARIRNQYLHHRESVGQQTQDDARLVLDILNQLLDRLFRVVFVDGVTHHTPELFKYMTNSGLLTPADP